jgi:hypothetical protein
MINFNRRSARTLRTRPAIVSPRGKLLLETLEDRALPSTVTNLLDSGAGSLRDAIAKTPTGGVVDFQPGLSGTIALTSGGLTVTKNLTITGPGASTLSVSGGGTHQVFNIAGGANVSIAGLTVRDGKAAHGGGIGNYGTLTLVDSWITNNTTLNVAGGGGGIFNSGTMTITGTTIASNSTNGNGGGVFNAGTLIFVNNTLAGNSGYTGGGIANAGTFTSTNSSIAGNASTGGGIGGGIYASGSSPVHLTNTIIATNTAGAGPDIYGSVATAKHNLVGNGSGSSGIVHGVNNNLVGTSSNPIDPKIGALQHNGGSTPTFAIQNVSPAKDSGTNDGIPAKDQRGFNRLVNANTDMGAYEYQQPETITTIVSAPNPSTVNQPVAITATVVGEAEGSNTPTGNVTFYSDGAILGTRSLVNGTTTLVTNTLTGGVHTLTATYGGEAEGDHAFNSSDSIPILHSVLKSASVSAVAGTPSPSNAFQRVTLTAFVTPMVTGPITPTGTVTFFDGETELATLPLNAQSTADYETSLLKAGRHFITVHYNGDQNFEVSDSLPREHVVQPLLPHSSVVSSLNPAKVAQAVTFDGTAFYPPDMDVPGPTGTITFLDGNTVLATVPLASGEASWTTSGLKAGKHSITARYDGDDYYSSVTSQPLTQTIRRITLFAVGGAPGHVLVYKPDNTLLADFTPYGANYTDGINVAVGDITGDGYYDLVTGAGKGNPHVKVYDGKMLLTGTFNPHNPDGSLRASFFPYALHFNVGSNVAIGDVDGDGYAELVTGANIGNPHVKVHDGADIAHGQFHSSDSIVAQWFPYALEFNVGASVAVGDVTGDGFAEVVTGANIGNPHVKVYDGSTLIAGAYNPDQTSLLTDWFAYGLNFNVGANVAVGDVVGDGYASIITGATTGNPHVRVYDGWAIASKTFDKNDPSQSEVDQFFAYELQFNVGATVGAGDFDEDGKAEVLTGASVGSPHYRAVKDGNGIVKPPAMFEGLPDDLKGGIAVGA